MSDKWYEQQAVEEWFAQSFSSADYDKATSFLFDTELIETGACCIALEENYIETDDFNFRTNEILKDLNLRQEVCFYLCFKDSLNLDKAKELFQQLQVKQGVDIPLPSPSGSEKFNSGPGIKF